MLNFGRVRKIYNQLVTPAAWLLTDSHQDPISRMEALAIAKADFQHLEEQGLPFQKKLT